MFLNVNIIRPVVVRDDLLKTFTPIKEFCHHPQICFLTGQARRLQDLLKNKTKQADFVEKLQVGPVMIGVMAEALGPDQEAELRKVT